VINDEQISYLGDWDEIEALNDASSLPEEILTLNPKIMTWEKVLGNTVTQVAKCM
jgi:hypothetical protein